MFFVLCITLHIVRSCRAACATGREERARERERERKRNTEEIETENRERERQRETERDREKEGRERERDAERGREPAHKLGYSESDAGEEEMFLRGGQAVPSAVSSWRLDAEMRCDFRRLSFPIDKMDRCVAVCLKQTSPKRF